MSIQLSILATNGSCLKVYNQFLSNGNKILIGVGLASILVGIAGPLLAAAIFRTRRQLAPLGLCEWYLVSLIYAHSCYTDQEGQH